jgi:predicted RNase H-like nuclease (RuvC/YqgF family)
VSDTKYKVHRVEIDNSMHRVVQVDDFAAAIAAKDAEIAALRAELAEARKERDRLREAIEQFIHTHPWGPCMPELAGLNAALEGKT